LISSVFDAKGNKRKSHDTVSLELNRFYYDYMGISAGKGICALEINVENAKTRTRSTAL
jgi:hypothetical protein